ncbi:MAG: hypothetical protein IIA51_10785, partial [Chloroflexi bacterium]|nr:hypothetical protein [Chloroflexota bacterium]
PLRSPLRNSPVKVKGPMTTSSGPGLIFFSLTFELCTLRKLEARSFPQNNEVTGLQLSKKPTIVSPKVSIRTSFISPSLSSLNSEMLNGKPTTSKSVVAVNFIESADATSGSIAITGALVQWLRDNLGIIRASSEVEELALEAEDNGGIYFVPAFSGLFAPYWRSDARGVIVGLTGYITKAHIARAALEATGYQTREVLEAMARDSGVKLKTLKVDGGMVHNELLMQFQADVLGVSVVRPKVVETTALGAAYAAGLAVGFWNDLEDLSSNWRIDKTWQPHMTEGRREQLYAGWLKAVERSFGWVD